MDASKIPDYWKWFPEGRFGLFIHWGPYSTYGRGEQVLFREHMDQREYVANACRWNPQAFDARQWAATARRAGMKYAVLTTRHHDGYCNWASQYTDYSSASQGPKRDFVREYVEAMREVGLRVGLYYSLCDWRIPAYWDGPAKDRQGWDSFCTYVHNQVRELLTNYGPIDILWFDGAWPHSYETWRGAELTAMIRGLQPHILINNRLGSEMEEGGSNTDPGARRLRTQGDFGTPEHHITALSNRLWESCQVSTWRLWGYTIGERWRPADLLLDMLVEAAGKGGNLLLNAGPTPDGRLPQEFVERAEAIGRWMDIHGEAIYGLESGDVCEFITYGRQTRKANNLYLMIRFWDGRPALSLGGLETRVKRVILLTTGQELPFTQTADHVTVQGLPHTPPTDLFPVIKLECDGAPRPCSWAADRLWNGNPRRMTGWAATRGTSVYADGQPR